MTSSSEALAREESDVPASSFSLWPLPELEGKGSHTPSGGFAAPEPATRSAEDIAYEKGVEDGRKAVAAELNASSSESTNALAAVNESLLAARQSCRSELEQLILRVGVAVARQIIGAEVKSDPTVLAGMVKRALDVVAWDSKVEVLIHPADLEAISDHFDKLNPGAKPESIEWVPDQSVGRGGCLVRPPACLVDGGLDAVLDDMYERMIHA